MIWRVVISERIPATYDDVDGWPLDRVLAANELLDSLAEGEAEHARKARAKAQAYV